MRTKIYEDEDMFLYYTCDYELPGEEKDWFDANTSESRLAKYWTSEEMAGAVLDWYALSCFPLTAEECGFRLQQAINGKFPSYVEKRNYLVQLLKKEWFR